jgi:hypothetical protein
MSARRLVVPAVALVLALPAGALRAQAGAGARTDSARRADSLAAYGPETPPAPHQFRIGPSAGALLWNGSAVRTPDDVATWGLQVERVLFRYLSVRFDASYLAERLREGGDSANIHGYLLELSAVPRLALGPLVRAGVVPFAEVGIGSLVFDPGPAGLPTRSQNSFALGAGVEVRLARRVGGRVQWRHYTVKLQSLFDAADLTSVSRRANRITAGLYWTF